MIDHKEEIVNEKMMYGEQVYGINKEFETCYLLSPATIRAHKRQGHNFLHIGLVQVGVIPLIKEGLNSSILMALRDNRHIRFDDKIGRAHV